MENRAVLLTLPHGVVCMVKRFGNQGCGTVPLREAELLLEPVDVTSSLSGSDIHLWPMVDLLPEE